MISIDIIQYEYLTAYNKCVKLIYKLVGHNVHVYIGLLLHLVKTRDAAKWKSIISSSISSNADITRRTPVQLAYHVATSTCARGELKTYARTTSHRDSI